MTRRLALSIILLMTLGACAKGGGEWHTKNVTGLLPDLAFSMTDDRGRTLTAADERGNIVLLFFGYTNCPDVCPTTLARLAQAREAMRDRGGSTRVLFVTVDPARDTEARLASYVRAFGDGVVGLRGSREAIDAVTRRYRVGYSLGPPGVDGQYEVTHSGGVFVFDREGKARLLIRPDDAVSSITSDLERLAGGARSNSASRSTRYANCLRSPTLIAVASPAR